MMSSLRVKLFALTCAVVVVVVALISAFFALAHLGALQQGLVAKAELYARMASRQTAVALAFDDVVTAREAFEAAAVDPDVARIKLRRADGSVLYELQGRAGVGRTITVHSPIVAAEGPVGSIELAVTDARVAAESRSVIMMAILAGFAWLSFGCGAAWLIGRHFGRRIGRVTAHAQTIAGDEAGQSSSLLNDTSRDEIGVLSRAFDTMTSTLDERVRVRTRELAEALAALRDSESFARAIVENAADGIFTATVEGGRAARILTWNAAAERIFAAPAADAIGKDVSIFLKRAALRLGRTEETITRADGTSTQLEVRFTETDGSERIRVGLVRDLAEEKRAAQKLAEMNAKLVDASRLAGMADVASGILHNVGNVLNSVNVSVTLLDDTVRRSSVDGVGKLAKMLTEKSAGAGGLAHFFAHDAKAKKVPEFVEAVSGKLAAERAVLGEEIAALRKNIDHIREIVSMQQAYTSKSGVREDVHLLDILTDAAELSLDTKGSGEIELVKDYDELPIVVIDRHRTMQILVNLLRNARHAVRDAARRDPRITLRVRNLGERIRIAIEDNGVGVAPEHFARLFEQGFTTKKDGHGYGLHSSANVAKELGGALLATSDGLGRGATFTLELPLVCSAQDAHVRKEAA